MNDYNKIASTISKLNKSISYYMHNYSESSWYHIFGNHDIKTNIHYLENIHNEDSRLISWNYYHLLHAIQYLDLRIHGSFQKIMNLKTAVILSIEAIKSRISKKIKIHKLNLGPLDPKLE